MHLALVGKGAGGTRVELYETTGAPGPDLYIDMPGPLGDTPLRMPAELRVWGGRDDWTALHALRALTRSVRSVRVEAAAILTRSAAALAKHGRGRRRRSGTATATISTS